MLGILYDIHGNLDALNAVLADAADAGVDRWLLGGDYGTPSPHPLETLARLRELPNATWIRGNGERWLVDPPRDPPAGARNLERVEGGSPARGERCLGALGRRGGRGGGGGGGRGGGGGWWWGGFRGGPAGARGGRWGGRGGPRSGCGGGGGGGRGWAPPPMDLPAEPSKLVFA